MEKDSQKNYLLKRIQKVFVYFLVLFFLICNMPASAIFIYSARSESVLSQEDLASTILPAFRYDRNFVELNTKSSIDLILNPAAKIVEIAVIKAEGAGLNIDNTELLEQGLKIITPRRLRTREAFAITLKEQKKEKEKFANKVKFNLKSQSVKPNIIQAVDFKIFKVFVKGQLPGSYTVQATVDGDKVAVSEIVTRPDFRIDIVTPTVVDIGVEAELTIVGKGLDSFTDVSIEVPGVEVINTVSLDDKTLKVVLLVPKDTPIGFSNITVTNVLNGKSATLFNGLYIGPRIGIDGKDGEPGPQGPQGLQGEPGINGMGVCDDSLATLMIFTNTLSEGSNATASFDPQNCTLTFGIPIGPRGMPGGGGSDGEKSLVKTTDEPSGVNCVNGGKKIESGVDSNKNDVLDSVEVQATNYVCNGKTGAVPAIEDVISNWSTLSEEKEFTTSSGSKTRMVKIPNFIHDGVIYGGFWVDKYEASKSDATATSEGTSSVPVGQRNVVPWTNISYATAKANASSSSRQISELGSCHLIKMKEWYALYLLGRFAKGKDLFGATSTNGWNERGNTRFGKDGRDNSSFTCSDDPTESGGGQGRCLTGTGYKSWGHLLDGSATKDVDGATLSGGGTADDTSNGIDAFDGDLQVYDLVGNVVEWVDYTITRSSSSKYTVDSGFQAAGIDLPFMTNNKFFSFEDILGNTNNTTNADKEVEFKGLGIPESGSDNNRTDFNGGANDGKYFTGSTNQQYGTVRGGNWTSGVDSRSPIYLDFSSTTTTTEDKRGFRVTCDFPN